MKRTALVLFLCATGLFACNDGGSADPSSPAERYATWRELNAGGEHAAARKELETLRAQGDNSPELALLLGLTLEQLGDVAKAVVTYKAALKEYPDDARLWTQLGHKYLELDQVAKARDAYLKSRELGNDDDAFRDFRLGVCMARLNDAEAAEREFQRALEGGHNEPSVKYNIALLRLGDNDFREAKRLLEEVLQAEPQNWEAQRELLNILLQTTDDPATVADVQRRAWDVVDHQPEDWRAHMLLGDAFMAADDYEAAVEAYTRALEYSQNLPEVEDKHIAAESARRDAEEQGSAVEMHDHAETISDEPEAQAGK